MSEGVRKSPVRESFIMDMDGNLDIKPSPYTNPILSSAENLLNPDSRREPTKTRHSFFAQMREDSLDIEEFSEETSKEVSNSDSSISGNSHNNSS